MFLDLVVSSSLSRACQYGPRGRVMHLVEIEGPNEVLSGLSGMTGIIVLPADIERLAPDRGKAKGYATDSAIKALETRGCRVTVHVSAEQRSRRLRAVWEAKNKRPAKGP